MQGLFKECICLINDAIDARSKQNRCVVEAGGATLQAVRIMAFMEAVNASSMG